MKLKYISSLALILCGLVISSCVDEMDGSAELDREISIIVSSQETKTSGITEIVFDEGDCLSLLDTRGNNSLFEQDDENSGVFKGKISSGSAPVYAVYPYCESASATSGEIRTVFPTHFAARCSNSVISGMNLSVGSVLFSNSTYSASLKNVCGIVGVSIPSEVVGIRNIKLVSLEEKPLSGTLHLDFNNGEPSVKSVEKGVHYVDFDIAYNTQNNKAEPGKYYFSVIPGTYKGIRLEITLLNGSVYSFESENTLVVERNKRTLLKEIKLSDVQSAPTSSFTIDLKFPSSDDGTYCPTLYKKEGNVVSYLPPYGDGNYSGDTYFFEVDGFEYPLYISSNNSAGTLNHCWWKSKSGLMFGGGAKDAYIMTPPISGKKLVSVSMATNGSVRRTIRIADYPDANADALENGKYVEGKSGANDQLGASIDVSSLTSISGQPLYIYFAHDAITISELVLSYEDFRDLPQVPDYYTGHISEKSAEVAALQGVISDGFVFWTDTHVSANSMHSPALINELLTVSSDPKVFWGGDAVPAYTTEPMTQWQIHESMLESLSPQTKVFNIHGNHDITSKYSQESTEGYTCPKGQVKDLFVKSTSNEIVRNQLDDNGMYYYYDQEQAKIRYVVVDLYENYSDENTAWGITSSISSAQMDWIFRQAVMEAPEDYKLMFIMHNSVGFRRADAAYKELYEALEALANHRDYGTFNFSSRQDLTLLMVLGGHTHHDMQLGLGGVFYVQTASDARYDDFKRNPFADQNIKRTSGSIYEHAFDYVGISEDYQTISMLRVGVGGNRIFHLKPITLSVGESLKLSSSVESEWYCYDSDSKYESSTWSLTSNVLSVSDDGTVSASNTGEAVVVAMDSDYNLELFYIQVFEETHTSLSDNGTANCYVISNAGKYKFDASVKGCGTEKIVNPVSAQVLWESYGSSTGISSGDLIKDVTYNNGYVFLSTPDALKNGNALVAVKDAGGNILWSWHIWCTSEGFKEVEYANGAGVMMDRNLGAARSSANTYTAFGLLYQWGRKDPFLSSASVSQVSEPKSTLGTLATVTSSEGGTVAYSVAHPTTFICEDAQIGDWLKQSDRSLWNSDKTIYDPCPYGWKVPYGGESNIWSIAKGTPMIFTGTWSSSHGMNFTSIFGTSLTTWYPAAGYRTGITGELSDSGEGGFYWSTTPSDGTATGFMFSSGSNVLPIYYGKADACSVRCIKE